MTYIRYTQVHRSIHPSIYPSICPSVHTRTHMHALLQPAIKQHAAGSGWALALHRRQAGSYSQQFFHIRSLGVPLVQPAISRESLMKQQFAKRTELKDRKTRAGAASKGLYNGHPQFQIHQFPISHNGHSQVPISDCPASGPSHLLMQ